MIGLAIVSTAAALPGDGGAPRFEPVPVGEAIAYFRQICVDTLPEPRAFVAAFNADRSGWVRYERRTRRTTVLGNFWRSPRGQLSYLDLPGLPFLDTNPACHYAFRIGADYSHDAAARALAAALQIDGGRETGTRREPQTRWEATLPTGLRVRVFLSTAERDMGGPAATLSISAYRHVERTRRNR